MIQYNLIFLQLIIIIIIIFIPSIKAQEEIIVNITKTTIIDGYIDSPDSPIFILFIIINLILFFSLLVKMCCCCSNNIHK